MTTRLSLEEIKRKVNKEFGDGTLISGDQLKDEFIPRIPSGLLTLDLALGGGWPENQWHEIIGAEGSGKTSIVLRTIAHNMQVNPKFECLWVDAENLPPSWARRHGIDMRRMHLVEDNTAEVVFSVVLEAMDNRAVDAVVIDSLPALVAKEEDDKTIDEFSVGVMARLNGKFFRKAGTAGRRSLTVDDRPCTGFIINQWRAKIGGFAGYGEPRTTPGGQAKNYWFFTRVEVKRDEWLTHDKEVVGQRIKMTTTKNKSFPPRRIAVVDFYFEAVLGHSVASFDRARELLAVGLVLGVIERSGASGAGNYLFNGESWRSRDALLATMREEPHLMAIMDKAVRSVALGTARGAALVSEEAEPKKRRVVVRK